jgi:hypothetical protein
MEAIIMGILKTEEGDGTYDVLYDDGVSEPNVDASLIRAVDFAAPAVATSTPGGFTQGQKIEARCGGKNRYSPGMIDKVRGVDPAARKKVERIITKMKRATHETEVEILSLFSNSSRMSIREAFKCHGRTPEWIEAEMENRRIDFASKNPSFSQAEIHSSVESLMAPMANLNLMREMRLMQSRIPREHCVTLAGTTVADFELHLSRVSPRILQFSGHATTRVLAFENQKGETQTLSVPQFQTMLKKSNLSSLEIIFLNCCDGYGFAEQLVSTPATAHIAVICWSDKVPNRMATFFSECFYDAIGQQLKKDCLTLFNEVCKAFSARHAIPFDSAPNGRQTPVPMEPVLVRPPHFPPPPSIPPPPLSSR